MSGVSDIVLLQDLTGSYTDDLAALQSSVPAVVNRLTNPNLAPIFGSSVAFGVASFKDKPVSPFGGFGDYVYKSELGLTTNIQAVKNVVAGFTGKTSGGGDLPEAQLEALMHAAYDSGGGLGYRVGSQRIILVATDANFHVAGEGLSFAGGTITTANDGDKQIESFEDYPQISQVKTALESANVVPIFLATSNVVSAYQGLVTQLARGAVVTLGSSSENISDAIKEGIAKARGVITDLGTSAIDSIVVSGSGNKVIFAGAGDDEVLGSSSTGNLFIDGGAGADVLYGGLGLDTVDGGTGNDFLAGGVGNDTLLGSNGDDIIFGGGGNDIIQGDSGNDTLTGGAGADKFIFDTGAVFAAADLGVDRINDFTVGTDRIQLSKDTFTALSSTTSVLNSLDFASVALDADVALRSERIVYSQGTGNLFYNQNGSAAGLGTGAQFAQLSQNLLLTSASFEVVDV